MVNNLRDLLRGFQGIAQLNCYMLIQIVGIAI